jgi:hypothetical protein
MDQDRTWLVVVVLTIQLAGTIGDPSGRSSAPRQPPCDLADALKDHLGTPRLERPQ